MWMERCDGLQRGCKGREERSSLIRRTGKLTESGLTWSQSLVTSQMGNAVELLQIYLLFPHPAAVPNVAIYRFSPQITNFE